MTVRTISWIPDAQAPAAPAGVVGPRGAKFGESPQTIASTDALVPDINLYDFFDITALAEDLAIAAPTGTPGTVHRIMFRILDDGSARAISWASAYAEGGVGSLPVATVPGKVMHAGFLYHPATSKWRMIAYSQEQ